MFGEAMIFNYSDIDIKSTESQLSGSQICQIVNINYFIKY